MRKAPDGKYQDDCVKNSAILVKSQAEADYTTEFDSVHKRESLIYSMRRLRVISLTGVNEVARPNRTGSQQMLRYKAWHKSQQVLESGPLAPLINFKTP